MDTKVCFKCHVDQPLSDYYKHPRMSDGHINKCKSCATLDARNDYKKKSSNEDWVDSERERGREKYKRLGYLGKYKHHEVKFSFRKSSVFKNLNRDLRRDNLITDGEVAHHWNYNLPLDYIIISKKTHARIHKKMNLDENSLCYIGDGELLDTKDKHIHFISKVGYES